MIDPDELFALKLEVRVLENDEQCLVDMINDKIASAEFPVCIKPYGEVKKSRCDEEIKMYGKYYIWDNYMDHLMASNVCLHHLASLAGLTNNDNIVSTAA